MIEYTVSSLFNCAIEIEHKAGDIYTKLSKLFSHIPEVSAFWDGLTKNEITHAKTLQEIFNSLTQEQLLAPPDKEIWESAIKIQNLLNKDMIGTILNLDDAYELAHELEHSEVNSIFKFLTIEVIPSDTRKTFVLSEIKQHLQKLLDFSKNFGDRTWRKQIKIQQ